MSTTVTEVFVWIIDDPSGRHKVAAFTDGHGNVMPMFTTERRIAELIRPRAVEVSNLCGFPIELRHFELVDGLRWIALCPRARVAMRDGRSARPHGRRGHDVFPMSNQSHRRR